MLRDAAHTRSSPGFLWGPRSGNRLLQRTWPASANPSPSVRSTYPLAALWRGRRLMLRSGIPAAPSAHDGCSPNQARPLQKHEHVERAIRVERHEQHKPDPGLAVPLRRTRSLLQAVCGRRAKTSGPVKCQLTGLAGHRTIELPHRRQACRVKVRCWFCVAVGTKMLLLPCPYHSTLLKASEDGWECIYTRYADWDMPFRRLIIRQGLEKNNSI